MISAVISRSCGGDGSPLLAGTGGVRSKAIPARIACHNCRAVGDHSGGGVDILHCSIDAVLLWLDRASSDESRPAVQTPQPVQIGRHEDSSEPPVRARVRAAISSPEIAALTAGVLTGERCAVARPGAWRRAAGQFYGA